MLSRRNFLSLFISICISIGVYAQDNADEKQKWDAFLIQKEELRLNFSHDDPLLKLDFTNYKGSAEKWKKETLKKYKELIGFEYPASSKVEKIREMTIDGVKIEAFIMIISSSLSIPAYVLQPADGKPSKSPVMAIHGHGRVEPVIGLSDDYHHKFAWELAKDGHLVIAPGLRGFSKLNDMAEQDGLDRLDYWEGRRQFTLATDGFLYGKSMVGETVEDLIRWENWFSKEYQVDQLDVCGISYGGDLTICYPVFSKRVNRIFCSGSMGSFTWIFRSCYNAPAHCIPGVLNWMDRAEIAGLNAPSPIMIHYGELDTPGDGNASAAYNPSGKPAYHELVKIYEAFGVHDAIDWLVTPNSYHEMDIPALLKYLDN